MSTCAKSRGPMNADLLYTDVEESLRASVRDLLVDRCPAKAVTACYDGDRSLTPGLWKALSVDLGLAALLVPQQHGGAGASAREAAVVLEELGRSVAPVPFLTSAVVGTTVLAAAGTPEAAALLADLATGQKTVALALPLTSLTADSAVSVGPGGGLGGSVRNAAAVLDADVLLVPVAGGAVHALPTVEAQIGAVSSLDMTRPVADVTFTGARGQLVVPADAGAEAVRRGLETGAALLASEQLGVAQWCLDETVAYLKQRRQFGRIVGGFQALKHRLADLYVAVESARAAARYAAVTLAVEDDDRPVATALAQAFCSDVAVRAAEEAVQLHGGIGMTWEHPTHLYLKRAKADQLAFGTPGTHLDRLAELVDLQPPN